jgi:ubiquitin thioesterase protein OTUB1
VNIESDQIHIVAMVNEFDVSVQVETLDLSRTSQGEMNHHVISPMSQDSESIADKDDALPPLIHLLYRPGHYDVLYAKIYS